MAEACKELGPEAMHWAEQADQNGGHTSFTLNYPQISYNPTAYDARGYSQVYTTQESRGKVMSQGANKLQEPFLANSIYSRSLISKSQ